MFLNALIVPVEKEVVESLEVRVSAADLRTEVFRLDDVLHVSEDKPLLLRDWLDGDGVQDEGVVGGDGARHDDQKGSEPVEGSMELFTVTVTTTDYSRNDSPLCSAHKER